MEKALREIETEIWLDQVIGGKARFGEDPDPLVQITDTPDPVKIIVDDGAPI